MPAKATSVSTHGTVCSRPASSRRGRSSKRRLHLVIHDFEPGWDTYIERQGYGADADLTFDDVSVDDYAAVLVREAGRRSTSGTTRASWRS